MKRSRTVLTNNLFTLLPEQIPKVAATCNFVAIMDGYYKTLFPLNPGSIRPTIPSGCEHEFLSKPHNRELINKRIRVPAS